MCFAAPARKHKTYRAPSLLYMREKHFEKQSRKCFKEIDVGVSLEVGRLLHIYSTIRSA